MTTVAMLGLQKGFNANELAILNQTKNEQISLNTAISGSRAKQQDFRLTGSIANLVGGALAEGIPKTVGAIVGFFKWSDLGSTSSNSWYFPTDWCSYQRGHECKSGR